MEFLTAALVYSIFALVSFGCFWLGQPLLHRVLPRTAHKHFTHLAGKGANLLIWCIPPPVRRGGVSIFEYLFYERNHIWQAIFISGTLVCYISAILDGAAFLYMTEPDTSHLLVPFVCLTVNTGFFMLCSLSNAGEINQDNCQFYQDVYAFDGVLYKKDSECVSCKIKKPARSKHCGIYDKCIYKFDHYCLWTANAVGGFNHRWFVGFLVSFCVMAAVDVWWMFRSLVAITEVFGLWKMKYAGVDGEPTDMDFQTICQTVFMQFPRLVFLLSVTILTFLMVASYASYHVYLMCTNQTTNERYKVERCERHAVSLPVEAPYRKSVIENVLDDLLPHRVFKKTKKG